MCNCASEDARLREDPESRSHWNEIRVRANARPAMMAPNQNPKQKKDQLSLAQYGDKLPANRPDPDDHGRLGAEESGTERTGPTQDCLFAIQHGGRWAEVRRYYD